MHKNLLINNIKPNMFCSMFSEIIHFMMKKLKMEVKINYLKTIVWVDIYSSKRRREQRNYVLRDNNITEIQNKAY